MSKFEKYLEEIELCPNISDEAKEAAAGSMAYVLALTKMFSEHYIGITDEPDFETLEQLVDNLHTELGAAAIFLSEKSFARVPDMLRTIASGIDNVDKEFTDPTGTTGKSVPVIMKQGYMNLADRIEKTRAQIQKSLNVLREANVVKVD